MSLHDEHDKHDEHDVINENEVFVPPKRLTMCINLKSLLRTLM